MQKKKLKSTKSVKNNNAKKLQNYILFKSQLIGKKINNLGNILKNDLFNENVPKKWKSTKNAKECYQIIILTEKSKILH